METLGEKLPINFLARGLELIRKISDVLAEIKETDDAVALYVNLIKYLKELGEVLPEVFLLKGWLPDIQIEEIENILTAINDPDFLKEIDRNLQEQKISISMGDSEVWENEPKELVEFVTEGIELLGLKLEIIKEFLKLKNYINSVANFKGKVIQIQDKLLQVMELIEKLVSKDINLRLDERVFRHLAELMQDLAEKLANDERFKDDFAIVQLDNLRSLVVGVWLVLRWQGEVKLDWIQDGIAELLFEILQGTDLEKGKPVVEKISDVEEYMEIPGILMQATLQSCEKNLHWDCLRYVVVSYKLQEILNALMAWKLSLDRDWSFLDKLAISKKEIEAFEKWFDENKDEDDWPLEMIIKGEEISFSKEDLFEMISHLYLIVERWTNWSLSEKEKKQSIAGIIGNMVRRWEMNLEEFLSPPDELTQ